MPVPADGGNTVERRIIIGKISGIQGITGWLKVYSYTRPRENIFTYSQWLVGRGDEWLAMKLAAGEARNNRLLARLDGIDDRDSARAMMGKHIAVYRRQLPVLPEGEYYWCDLIRFEVVNQDDRVLGKVTGVQETGANDVLIVEGDRRYLIPVVFDHFILDIDPDREQIRVDWDPEHS